MAVDEMPKLLGFILQGLWMLVPNFMAFGQNSVQTTSQSEETSSKHTSYYSLSSGDHEYLPQMWQ